jgi:hypothetical protein
MCVCFPIAGTQTITDMQDTILKRWQNAENYMGEDFSDYFIVTSFSRDSDVVSVANFIGIADHLMDIEPESERGWKIVRFGHWACGYLYCVLVHENSPLVKECEAMVKAVREYGIYDEDILIECESMIEESLSDVDTETRMQMLIEAPASLICEPLLKPYL